MAVTVTIDRIPELSEMVEAFDGVQVLVGFTGQHPDASMANAQLAYIHEYGSPARNIPARPAIGPGLRDARDAIGGLAYQAARAAALAPRNRKQVLAAGMARVGDACVVAVKTKIRENQFTPLAESTVRRKGHDQAWIDSGALVESLTSTVSIRRARRRAG